MEVRIVDVVFYDLRFSRMSLIGLPKFTSTNVLPRPKGHSLHGLLHKNEKKKNVIGEDSPSTYSLMILVRKSISTWWMSRAKHTLAIGRGGLWYLHSQGWKCLCISCQPRTPKDWRLSTQTFSIELAKCTKTQNCRMTRQHMSTARAWPIFKGWLLLGNSMLA